MPGRQAAFDQYSDGRLCFNLDRCVSAGRVDQVWGLDQFYIYIYYNLHIIFFHNFLPALSPQRLMTGVWARSASTRPRDRHI